IFRSIDDPILGLSPRPEDAHLVPPHAGEPLAVESHPAPLGAMVLAIDLSNVASDGLIEGSDLFGRRACAYIVLVKRRRDLLDLLDASIRPVQFNAEPTRLSRRLQLLRGWSDEDISEIFP